MSVTKSQVIARGWTKRCPNCGRPTLFPSRSFRINRRCPACGAGFDRGDGFFLGPWVLNYAVTVFGFVLPVIVLGARGTLPWGVATGLAVAGSLALPAALYRLTWSWWLMLYFFFLPDRLPANGGPVDRREED